MAGSAQLAQAVDEGQEQVVVFKLAEESYGVDISCVREIITMQRITRVPRAPAYVEGVINLRGHVIPVVDLRKRLGLKASEFTPKSRIVVMELSGRETAAVGQDTVGMIVDGVSEVLRIPKSLIEPASSVTVGPDSRFIRGIARLDDQLIVLLDLTDVTKSE